MHSLIVLTKVHGLISIAFMGLVQCNSKSLVQDICMLSQWDTQNPTVLNYELVMFRTTIVLKLVCATSVENSLRLNRNTLRSTTAEA